MLQPTFSINREFPDSEGSFSLPIPFKSSGISGIVTLSRLESSPTISVSLPGISRGWIIGEHWDEAVVEVCIGQGEVVIKETGGDIIGDLGAE